MMVADDAAFVGLDDGFRRHGGHMANVVDMAHLAQLRAGGIG